MSTVEVSPSIAADLEGARAALELADGVIATAITQLTELGGPDREPVFAYERAHAGAGIATANGMLEYGAKGEVEARLTCGFVADAVHDLVTRLLGRESLWGSDHTKLATAHDFVATFRDPSFLASLATTPGLRHLPDDMDMVRDAFGSFAQDVIAPHAEHVHRTNGDVP